MSTFPEDNPSPDHPLLVLTVCEPAGPSTEEKVTPKDELVRYRVQE